MSELKVDSGVVAVAGDDQVNGTGTLRGFAKVTRDLTVVNQVEEEKAALLARNQALVQALAEIVYDWRPQTDDLRWEGNYTRILGYSDEEIGRDTASWTSRVHPEDLDRVLREVEDAKREGRCYDLEYRFRRCDGTYAWMHDRGVLSLDAEENLERIVGMFRDISERKNAEEALQESERQLRQLLEDRERISQDLHDNVIQSLYAVALGLESCRLLVAVQPVEVRRRLNRSIAHLKGTIGEVRRFIAQTPRLVRRRGRLLAALASMARMMGDTRLLRFRMKVDPAAADRLPVGAVSHILAIVQEAASNSLRHSTARRISVSLQHRRNHVRLTVSDDGKGFNPRVKGRAGQGLKNIASRSQKLGARLQIEAKSGRGVQIVLEIPHRRTYGNAER